MFMASMFFSAFLLFALEPLITRMVLPLMGGSASVWNTALLFFQSTLLVGYAYAHALSKFSNRVQLIVHGFLLVFALLFLPPGVENGWLPLLEGLPVVSLLVALTAAIGIPFLALAATAPLVQRWYSQTGDPGSDDPYFLYAASNIGSITALISYPIVIEPLIGLGAQTGVWSAGFLLAGCLILATGARAAFGKHIISPSTAATRVARPTLKTNTPANISFKRRVSWLVWSFVPSAMLLAVTLHISVDVASAPFLWVIPLTLYLLSYAIAFARHEWIKPAHALTAQAWLIIAVVIYFTAQDLWLILGLHIGVLFVTGLVCHQALAASRPPAEKLTEFYLWTSIGGWLGGLFGALLAPMVFDSILEYPLLLVLACFVRPEFAKAAKKRESLLDIVLPIALGTYFLLPFFVAWINPVNFGSFGPLIYFAILIVALNAFRNRSARFGGAIAIIVLGGQLASAQDENILGRWRSFYGVYEVSDTVDGRVRLLQHGTTIHGAQALDSRYADWPLTYYNREGPLGQAIHALRSAGKLRDISAVGLGVGTLACHFTNSQNLTFYEIDPLVAEIATNSELFTYLKICGHDTEIVIQDGRLGLAAAADASLDMIILDAFTSDAIPVHLLTREALQTYMSKLRPAGVLLIHVSNKFVDLPPLLHAATNALGLATLKNGYSPSPSEHDRGGYASDWIIIGRDRDALSDLAANSAWRDFPAAAEDAYWTDDYSNVFRALRWDQLLWSRGE
jgi:hypothetical protein